MSWLGVEILFVHIAVLGCQVLQVFGVGIAVQKMMHTGSIKGKLGRSFVKLSCSEDCKWCKSVC